MDRFPDYFSIGPRYGLGPFIRPLHEEPITVTTPIIREFKAGDRVRVLRNNCHAPHPEEPRLLRPGDEVVLTRMGYTPNATARNRVGFYCTKARRGMESYIIAEDIELVMTTTRKFWCIKKAGGGSPNVEHDTEVKANEEAERLARDNPGHTFHVLEAKRSVRVAEPSPPPVAWSDAV